MTPRYYAYRVMPNGSRKRLKPGGHLFFGSSTVTWLRRYAKARGFRLVVKRQPAPPATRRDLIVAWARWALTHEPSFHYRQSRPMPLAAARARRLPIYTDCSGFVTMAYHAAGAPDPNGLRYSGQGYTGTLRSHARRKRLADVRAGDFIVYGGNTGRHVVLVMQGGADPLVASHGQESGPKLYRHSDEVRFHGGTFTCHDAGV